nr:asparagine synthase C-terminal domain-containing protein [Asticcacaulis aquaticus]
MTYALTWRDGVLGDLPMVGEMGEESLVRHLPGSNGLLLGRVYPNHPEPAHHWLTALDVLPAEDAQTFLKSHCWGDFIVLLPNSLKANTLDVLRSPCGLLDCFLAHQDGTLYIFSDLAQAQRCGLSSPPINWRFITHSLCYAGLPEFDTGLDTVQQLLPGFSATCDDTAITFKSFWSPWPGADRRQQYTTMAESVFSLRATVDHVMRSYSHTIQHGFIELSGGLDSSIVATCLSRQKIRLSGFNLVTSVPGADERIYARDVAESAQVSLVYCPFDSSRVRALPEPARPGPLPGMEMLQAAVDDISQPLYQAAKADALFSGAGGDSVLCYLPTAASATDALIAFGPGRRFLSALQDLSALHNITLWKAGKLAIKKALRRSGVDWKRNTLFLAPDLKVPVPFKHPWLQPEGRVLRGKAEHVRQIISTKFFGEVMERRAKVPVYLPLLAQPVVETALRIPTWFWFDGGYNRAVARHAFADRLPTSVRLRRSKGNFTSFNGLVFDRNRAALQTYLCDGQLAGAGILDIKPLADYLSRPLKKRDAVFHRVFELARMEAWVRATLKSSDSHRDERDDLPDIPPSA